jgi:excisionase family DNA binding protein
MRLTLPKVTGLRWEQKVRPLTVRETAAELNVSVHTIRAWIAARRLGHVRLGRAVRVPMQEIERLIQRGTVPAERQDR